MGIFAMSTSASSNDQEQDNFSQKIVEEYKRAQDEICSFLVTDTGEKFLEDEWNYEKGSGGGRTRVWEGSIPCAIEKGGVNFSAIEGSKLPEASNLPNASETGFLATGVSIVIHPYNPHVPTIHMNIRYFETTKGAWWFGGGIDLTPYYPQKDQVVFFHKTLKSICQAHDQDYQKYKEECDRYFYLPHRNEARGVGGIFFDHLDQSTGKTKQELLDFTVALAKGFIDIYQTLLPNRSATFSQAQRDFQLIRRGRYVEFNLLWDRGTKFGIQSQGRTESILMSLPANVTWKYSYTPEKNTPEDELLSYYLIPKDWAEME